MTSSRLIPILYRFLLIEIVALLALKVVSQ